MDNKEIAKQLSHLIHQVKLNQADCPVGGLEIHKLRMVIDHLDVAIDLLDVRDPWV